jgi:hypothetical protein
LTKNLKMLKLKKTHHKVENSSAENATWAYQSTQTASKDLC